MGAFCVKSEIFGTFLTLNRLCRRICRNTAFPKVQLGRIAIVIRI